MSQNVTYPPVTETLYEEIVRRILSVGMPTKIVLFGSYARGEEHQDSDLDILIIKNSDLPRYRRAGPGLKALAGVFPAKDLVVWTPEEVDQWAGVSNAFITVALKEGLILYEQSDRSDTRLVSQS